MFVFNVVMFIAAVKVLWPLALAWVAGWVVIHLASRVES